MNQSSTFLLATEEVARGAAGLPFAALYRRIARENGARLVAEASPSGWLPEASGPSFSYAGIQHWHMGRYLELTRKDPEGEDSAVRGALAASYRFFSRFTAEEPDGQRATGFNFSHRIGVGFELEQYQGARGMTEDIPEVALWSDWQFPQSGKVLEQNLASVKSLAAGFGGPVDAIPRMALGGSPSVGHTLDSTKHPTLPTLPAMLAGNTDVVLPEVGTGLPPGTVTVRRASYYAALFVGHPAPRYAYAGHFKATRAIPLMKGSLTIEDIDPATEQGYLGDSTTPHAIDLYEQSPMVGGGLSLLTTPTCGSALLATNWSPLTHHGLVAEIDDLVEAGKRLRYWEDYEQVTTDRAAPGPGGDCARLFPAAERLSLPIGLTVYGRLEGQPQEGKEALPFLYPNVCHARHYTFADDHVAVRVLLKRSGPASHGGLRRLFENLPVPTCTRSVCSGGTGDGGTLNRKSKGASIGFDATLGAQLVHVRDGASPLPRGMDLVLPPGRQVTLRPHGLRYSYYGSELQIGRVELELEVPATDTVTTSLEYQLVPVN